MILSAFRIETRTALLAPVRSALLRLAAAALLASASSSVPFGAQETASAEESAFLHEPGVIRTIVLDPGHGGEEVGAIGRTGLFEKDLCLDLARRLQDRLTRNHGLEVLLTREDDRLVPLRERTAFANHAKADLFISVHLNSSRRASAHGTETYFLALTASDEEALILAQAENVGSAVPGDNGGTRARGEGGLEAQVEAGQEAPGAAPAAQPPPPFDAPPGVQPGAPPPPLADPNQSVVSDLDLVLWGMAQSEHIVRSSRLAETIQDEMNRLLNVQSRGVKQAPFTVLMGATMPAALVEVAFLSNESEEGLLATSEFRDKVAEALEIAIVRFKGDSERALTAAPPPSGPEPLP